MTDPMIEDIRARVDSRKSLLHYQPRYLLTKLDEAEKANPPVEVGSPDGSQVYEIPLTEYLEQMNANQIFRATQAEAKLVAAEERERVLLAGVRELAELMSPEAIVAATGISFDDSLPVDGAFIADVAEYTTARTAKVRAILSGLLPSTTNEKGGADEFGIHPMRGVVQKSAVTGRYITRSELGETDD